MTTLKEALDQLAQGHMLDNEQKELIIDKWQKELGIQPCEDAVSRKDIYFKLTNGAYPNESIEQFIDRLVKELNTFPPVTPKPKTGHWFYDKSIENWRCSECNETPKTMGYCGSANFMAKHFKFCNHCGVRMVEPQENEE